MTKQDFMKKVYEAADFLKKRLDFFPEIALVLGSGLGFLADNAENKTVIKYSEIPNFPITTAPLHKGELIACKLCGKEVLLFCGRLHYYEGYSMQEVAFPVWLMKLLGIKTLIQTNAVGAINTEFSVGDIVLINDHIKFFNDTPLTGTNPDKFGERFFDMSDAYSKRLRTEVKKIAKNENITLKDGIYAYMPGPCYETPAEIRMLHILGADVVGMSTVPETIAAVHSKMEVLTLSFCSNMAAGIENKIEELRFTDEAKENLNKLILGILCHGLEEKCTTEIK